jgi:hypothetical protein
MMINQVYKEGRLIRREWAGTDEDGRQLLCLYTALLGARLLTTTPQNMTNACPICCRPANNPYRPEVSR